MKLGDVLRLNLGRFLLSEERRCVTDSRPYDAGHWEVYFHIVFITVISYLLVPV